MLFSFHAMGLIEEYREGPITEDVMLVDTNLDTGTHAGIKTPSEWELKFETADEKTLGIDIRTGAWQYVYPEMHESEPFVRLTLYPKARVFVSCAPWPEGETIMAERIEQLEAEGKTIPALPVPR